MTARPLPTPESGQTSKKAHLTVANGPAIRKQLNTVMKKRWFRIAGIAVAVFLVILIALPLLINVNSFRPRVESDASTALGRQVTVGNLSLSILSGSVGADNIAISDDPGFSKSPFVTAKSLKVGVELMPLIFSKQLNVTDIKLEEPQITLLKAANGKWNFSSIGGAAAKKPPEPAKSGSSPTNLSVAKLNINRGKLSVGKANSSARPVVYDNVNFAVTNFSMNSQFPFQLTAKLPQSGDVNVSGKAGPINAEDAAKTPFETAVKVNNMSIVALGVIDPASGIAGLANFNGTLNSNGSQAKAAGLFTGSQLKFSPKGTPATKTVTIKHTVDVDLDKQAGTITRGDVTIGSAQAHLTGAFHTQGDKQVVNMKLNAPNMPVDELEAMLPSMGVVPPSGSQLKGGTLSAELAIVGPLDKLVITGPVRLANTKLANFDLGSKLGSLAAFAGKSVSNPDTAIQNASLNAQVAPEGTKADNINLMLPAIGVITGAGTVSPAGALAFKMVADLHGGMVGGLSKVAGEGSGKGGIPFAIEGTTSSPKFIPDVGGVVGGLAKGELGNVAKGQIPGSKSVTKGLGGILGKKKQ
ncbi:MAG TPA: AsmA family protein [Terriglobales bacterium]|nr:AsmA family protein [Terriglobales bacterium]